MVKLDLRVFKYLTADDFRVLMAIELGMRNHEYVPANLIESIAKIKRNNTAKIIGNLLKNKLIEHYNKKKYEGYRLNYGGYDFLAIRVLLKKGLLVRVLSRMGVGKESDVYFCLVNPDAMDESDKIVKELNDEEIEKAQMNLLGEDFERSIDGEDEEDEDEEDEEDEEESENDNKINKKGNFVKENDEEVEEDEEDEEEEEGEEEEKLKPNASDYENYIQLGDVHKKTEMGKNLVTGILKLARLGRTSFRAIKNKRDFAKNKSHYNWLYLSRLSTQTEYKFLKGLYEAKFPVPKPYGSNRHVILMDYIESFQLSKVNDIKNPDIVYNNLKAIIYRLAEVGLVHGDLNEFNILIGKDYSDEKIHIIDFTQMISIDHEKAETYYKRDLLGIRNFFKKKMLSSFSNSDDMSLDDLRKNRTDFMDIKLNAFGAIKKLNRHDLEEIETIESDNKDPELLDSNEFKNLCIIDSKENNNKKFDDSIGIELEDTELANILSNVNKDNEKTELDQTQTQNNDLIVTQNDIKKKVMKIINQKHKNDTRTKVKQGKNKKGQTKKKGKADQEAFY